MNLPLLLADSLWLVLLLGIAFGFFLEQGGMGNALKISGQFYFRDMAVLKIMFSAIVTTALGLFWFSKLGWLDYDLIHMLPTFTWPQITGGLIFGAGFVVGGLCPGTSCVALASGRIDGLALLLGLFAGIFLFNESYPLIEPFYRSSDLGPVNLADVFGISHGAVLLMLVLIALAAFAGSEWIEKRSKAA